MRIRWFLLGATSAVAALAWLAGRVKLAQQRLTAETMTRAALGVAAGGFERAGRRLVDGPRVVGGDERRAG